MHRHHHIQLSWKKEGERALLALIILAGTALRVYQLGAKGFWGDEIWTAERSGWTAAQIVSFSLDNTVGPWTYLAGRFSLLLLGAGQQEFALRWAGAAAGIMAIPVVWALAHRLWGKTAGLLAAALMAASPYQVWYAQDARYYAWLVLFSTASFYFLYRSFEEPRRIRFWTGFSLFTILNIYNHPLSALLVGASQIPFCLIYGFRTPDRTAKVWGLAGSCAALGLASAPLILRTIALGQINTEDASDVLDPVLEGWLNGLVEILATLVARFGAEGWSRWFFLALTLLGILALARGRQWRPLTLLAPPLILAPLFFAVWGYPFIIRYVLFLQPLYLMLAARGIVAVAGLSAWAAERVTARRPPWQGGASAASLGAIPAAAAIGVLAITSLITTSHAYTQAKPIDWRSLAAYLQTHAQPQDMIVARYHWAGAALRWYFDPSFRFTLFDAGDPDTAALQSGAKRVWLIQPVEQPLDLNHPQSHLAPLNLAPDEGWKDPRLRYEAGFFPISELPVQLYVGETSASWINFAKIPQPNWTDRAYSDIEPGDALYFSLSMPGEAPRELWVTYFDFPQKELEVSIDGQIMGVIGGDKAAWQAARFLVPDGVDDIVDVTIRAVGADTGGVSHAELRAAPR